MSQRAKKRKLNEIQDGVKEYIRQVDDGEEEGEFGKNCLVGCKDPEIKEFLEKQKFEIHPLIYKEHEIGSGKCTHPSCIERSKIMKKKTFVINDNYRSGFKMEHIRRHCRRNHVESKPKSKPKQNVDKSQTTLHNFKPKKKLTKEQVSKIRKKTNQVICHNNTSLGLFSTKEMKERDSYILEIGDYDGKEVDRFDVGPEPMKAESRKTSECNKKIIKMAIQDCVAKGRYPYSVLLDHKSTRNQTAEKENWCVGIGLLFTDDLDPDDIERHSYLLDYFPVPDQKDETNAPLVKEVLEWYGLMDLVNDGRVSFVGDQKCESLAKMIAPNCLVEICNFHNLSNLIKRSCDKNLKHFDLGADGKRSEIQKLISKAPNGMSDQELKKHHTNTAKSINSWLFSHELTEEDKINVAKYKQPKGWKDEFENSNQLSDEDKKTREKVLSKITEMPSFKKVFDIRPRTIEPSLIALLCLEPHWKAAIKDVTHPLHAHTISLSINFHFVHSQYSIVNRIGKLIDYFESNKTYQAGEYLTAMTHLVKWISQPEDQDTLQSICLLNHKRALMASISEQLVQSYISADKTEVTNRRVPCRITDTSLIANRLYFINSNAQAKNRDENMNLREMRFYLLNSKDDVLTAYNDLLKKKTKRFAADADKAILKLGRNLQLDSIETTFQESTNLLADDDSDEETNPEALYNVEKSSLKSQLSNFISQPFSHIIGCKYRVSFKT